MPEESMDRYTFELIERVINNSSFEDNGSHHKSEKFLLDQKHIANYEANSKTEFVENEDNYVVKNIKWPSIGEFNPNLGMEKIDEFIKTTWEYNDCWLYCIDFLQSIDKEFSSLHNYRVRWSIPTRRKPIPRFTASVYFTYEVSKIKPKDTEVNVYFVLETQKLVHKPGVSRFRQQWLNDIIEIKETLIKDCKF